MDKQSKQNIWDLTVGKLHNSLDETEQDHLHQFEDSNEAQQSQRIGKQLQSKIFNAFSSQQINKEKQWKHIRSRIGGFNPVRKLVFTLSKYAAVFIIALSIGILAPTLFHNRNVYQATNAIEVEWGHMSKMTLSDGTQVWLNAGTTFEYPTTFNSNERLVSLNGEAQFKVSHSDDVPFEVETKTGIVKVYGTTFNVSSYDDDPDLIVTLVEGKVGVETVEGKLLRTLNPSEQIAINKRTGHVNVQNVNTEFYNSWIDGKILLKNTKLSDLSKILSRWYNVDITIVGEDTGNMKISGTVLKGKPLDLFLKVMEGIYGIKYELKINRDKKDELRIYKN